MNAQEWNKHWKDYFDQIYKGVDKEEDDDWWGHRLYITKKGNQLRVTKERFVLQNDLIHNISESAYMSYWPLGYCNEERSDILFICFI